MIKPLFCPKVEKNREFSARIACVEAVSARTTYGIHSALFTNGSGLSTGAPRQALGAPPGPSPRLRRRVADRQGERKRVGMGKRESGSGKSGGSRMKKKKKKSN